MELYIYAICFAIGLLFTIASAVFGHVLGGHDAHFDVGTHGHAEAGFNDAGIPGLSPFSPTTICSFITAFGGFGLIFTHIQATRSVWISTPLSLLGGLIVAGGVMLVFGFMFHKTQGSSESRISALVGRTATVISPIPATGVGEIAYIHGGTRYTAPARELNGVAVSTGKTVKISRVAESQFFVESI